MRLTKNEAVKSTEYLISENTLLDFKNEIHEKTIKEMANEIMSLKRDIKYYRDRI